MEGKLFYSDLQLTGTDAHVMMLDIPNHPNCAMFGIFDGHGGSEIASLVAKELPEAICELPDIFDEEGFQFL